MNNPVLFILIFKLLQCICESRLVWKNDIRISSNDFEEDLEQIPSKLLASLGLLVEQSKLERFDSLTNGQPEVGEEYEELPLREYNYQTDYEADELDKLHSRKRLADGKVGKVDYDSTEATFINGTESELDYNLEEFKRDYDSRLPEAPKMATVLPLSNMSVVQSEDDRPFEVTETVGYSQTCVQMSLWKYLFFGVPCIVHETRTVFKTGKYLNIVVFSLKTILVVFPSIFFVLLGFWCYNGMCSCFFPLEFFHPYREIIKIKKEAYNIPPGVYIDEDGKRWNYTPSEEEKVVYDELLKLIRS